MSLHDEINTLYWGHGTRHILPFIGDSYDQPSDELRVLVVGLNAYISDGDWPEDDTDVQQRYPDWWRAAGHANSHHYHEAAYKGYSALIDRLKESALLAGLSCKLDAQNKPELYATNAVKFFLPERFKDSNELSSERLATQRATWHGELDTLAKHSVFPHVIVIFAEKAWRMAWQAFHPNHWAKSHQHFRVMKFVPGADGGTRHYANRITAEVGGHSHEILLVRLHHPSARSKVKCDADWLVAHSDFRELAGLSASE